MSDSTNELEKDYQRRKGVKPVAFANRSSATPDELSDLLLSLVAHYIFEDFSSRYNHVDQVWPEI